MNGDLKLEISHVVYCLSIHMITNNNFYDTTLRSSGVFELSNLYQFGLPYGQNIVTELSVYSLHTARAY